MNRRRQRIYLMLNIPFIFLVKVGISKNVGFRRRTISKSMTGKAVTLLSVSIPAAKAVEQFIHGICAPINVTWMGSGKSEWFLLPALIIALPTILVVWASEWLFYASVILLIIKLSNLL